MTAEQDRLQEKLNNENPWRAWGPYVSARQWGTVREDYSADGDAWGHFPFDHAHQRAYRWGEDGLGALCDKDGYLNLGIALWNGNDDRLKERLFGLTNPQGNHGEDVKEYWWAVDATPTHSYAQWLYRYPQAAFPYADLVHTNAARGYGDDEYELADTGVLNDNRFFDITVTHAKASPTDILVTITATNHGPETAPVHLVPTWWFRNTWAWEADTTTPHMSVAATHPDSVTLLAEHPELGTVHLCAQGQPTVLMCDNDTAVGAVFGTHNITDQCSEYPKDAINRTIVHGEQACNPHQVGTKAGLWWHFDAVAPGESVSVRLRMTVGETPQNPFDEHSTVVAQRQHEADEFYSTIIPTAPDHPDTLIARRAYAGLMWGKQLYLFDVDRWVKGDPQSRYEAGQHLHPRFPRNHQWRHMRLEEVISMPDEWEYPWFAAWDLAFHCVAIAHIDPDFAKQQMLLMCREWAMHPNGQLPAYEWNFGDVNPPAHAWAAWQIYAIDGFTDRDFLERITIKLMLNFPWWVNRKDSDGSHIFEGGFLGLDNVGLFDRSHPLPDGQRLEQADATAWMGMFCVRMFRMATELARTSPGWDEAATKFLVHFLAIDDAMDGVGHRADSLWDDNDHFFHDVVRSADGHAVRMPVRSMVGLLPLTALAVIPDWVEEELPEVTRFLHGWLKRRPEKMKSFVHDGTDAATIRTLSLPSREQWEHLVRYLLDEEEFLAPHGIRSLSGAHRDGVTVDLNGQSLTLAYLPGESDSWMFGGNSNWRGPIWFPVNAMLTNALRVYSRGARGSYLVEYPTGSGEQVELRDVARQIEDRLISMFRPGADGRRPSTPQHHPGGVLWDCHPTFSEYFHGDNGQGLGASHQTGWTALVAHFICAPEGIPYRG